MIEDQNDVSDETPKARDARARAEAASWYAKMRGSSVSHREVAAFYAWRGDSLNDAAYTRIEALGQGVSAAADDPRLKAIAQAALNRPPSLGRRLKTLLAKRPAATTIGFGSVLAAAALAAALFLGPPGARTYKTDVGERRAIALEDGSTLELNTDSQVRVRLTKHRRDLTLDRGQAMFAVAHDAGRPFIVTAGDTSVRAIGTRFDVYRARDAVRVTLAQGRVEVRNAGAASPAVTLTPGQRLDVGAGSAAKPVIVDAAAALGWADGRLTFKDARLADAVTEINRYSRRKVVLGPDAPADRLVNGVFDAGDTEAFVAGVSALFDLKSAARPGGDIELRGPAAEPSPA